MKLKIALCLLFLFGAAPVAQASHYDLLDIDIISSDLTDKLVAAKIENTEDLFSMLVTKAGREDFSKKYNMPVAEVEKLGRKLELMQIVGVGPKAAALLQLSGITSLKMLTESKPEELLEVLLRVNREFAITGVQPDLTVVRDWIEKSKKVVNHME
ncbi:MAG: DUF4332 domain-containing protein [Proteobacteria bacterium]|nr:DUF4332 domain-containing protein [Pseudomonadota bacterium]